MSIEMHLFHLTIKKQYHQQMKWVFFKYELHLTF